MLIFSEGLNTRRRLEAHLFVYLFIYLGAYPPGDPSLGGLAFSPRNPT